MSRYTRKHGATLRRPMRPRVSDEQAARLLCTHSPNTPPWARAAIDATWVEVRFGFAVQLSRGESFAELGAIVVDLDAIPGGRMLDPEGGTIGLTVGREKLRELAASWVGEEVGTATDADPGERAVWFLVLLPERPPCLARVHLRIEGDAAPAEAFTVGADGALYIAVALIFHAATTATGKDAADVPVVFKHVSGRLAVAVHGYQELVEAYLRHPRRFRKLEREILALVNDPTTKGGDA